MKRFAVLCTAGISLAGLFACTEPNPAFSPPDPVCALGEFFVAQPFTLADPDKVDVLLVVDNSAGMLANQRVLAAAMPQFVSRLNAVDGLDWRAGVISTDLADQGRPLTGPSGQSECPAELPTFVERSSTNPGVALGCNVMLGQEGSDFEQGLESARRAIEGNAEFLRDDARLVVVFFSNEDDCTAQDNLDRSDANNCVWQQNALVSSADFGRYFSDSARPFAGNPVSVVSIVAPRDNRSYATGETPVAACTNGATPAFSGGRYIDMSEAGDIARYGFTESICATSFVSTVERIVDEAIDIDGDDLCMRLDMSGAPQTVLVKSSDGSSQELSELGDYLAVGSTDACPEGAITIAADAHGGDRGSELEVRFCTTTNPTGQ